MSLLTFLSADLAQDRRVLLRRYAAILADDAQIALAAIAMPDTPALNTTDPEALSSSKGDEPPRVTQHAVRNTQSGNPPPHAKLKDLKFLMKCLGKTESDVAADLAVIRRAGRAQRSASLPGDHLARTAAAREAVAAYDAETASLLQSRRGEYFRLYNAACELQEQRTRAKNARIELQRLKQANPDLLAHLPEPERTVVSGANG